MQALKLLGTIATLGGLGYVATESLPPLTPSAPVVSEQNGTSLAEALSDLKRAEEEKKNRILVLKELMEEINSQNVPGSRPKAEPPQERAPAGVPGFHDPAALERLHSWKNISPELKAEILRQYRMTGYLPGASAPAAAPASAPSAASARAPERIELPNGSFIETARP